MIRIEGSRFGFWRAAACLAFALLAPLAACKSQEEKVAEHLFRAQQLESQGNAAAALIELRTALQLDPKSAGLNFRIAKTLLTRDKLPDAFFFFGEAHRLDPDRADAPLAMAKLMLFEDPEGAAKLIDGVIARHPGNPLAYIRRSELALARSNAQTALAAAEKAAELDPDATESHRQLGVVHQARIRSRQVQSLEPDDDLFRAALGAYDRVVELRGERGAWLARLNRARIFAAWPGHREEAAGAFREAVDDARKTGGSGARASAARAALNYARRVRDAALQSDALENLVAADPENLAAWEELARLAGEGNGDDAGDTVYRKLLDARPRDVRAHVSWAQHLQENGRNEEAVAHLESTVEKGLDLPVTLAALAHAQAGAGRNDDADATVERMESEFPQHLRTALATAERAIREERFGDASAVLRQRLGTVESSEGERLLATVEFRAGELGSALAALERSIELARGFPTGAYRLRVRVQEAVGDCAGALKTLALLERHRRSPEPAEQVVGIRCLYAAGRDEIASRTLERLLAQDPPPLGAVIEFASRQGASDPERARTLLEAAHARVPRHPGVLERLTALDLESGDVDAALRRVEAAVDGRAGASARLLVLRARVFAAAGESRAAESDARRAYEIDPRTPGALSFLMRSYAREGRITEAIPMLEDSRQSDRLGPKGRVLLAQLYVESGDEEQARAVLEETLAAESTPEAKNDLAFLLAREGGELDEALRLAIEARQELGDDATVADTLGFVYLQSGLPSAALDQFRHALELAEAPRERKATYHYHQGLAERALGRDDRAIAAFEAALALDSGFPEARAARRELKALRSKDSAAPEPDGSRDTALPDAPWGTPGV